MCAGCLGQLTLAPPSHALTPPTHTSCPLVTQHMYNLMGGARVGDTDFSNLFWPKHKVSMGEMATWFGHFANLVSGVGAGGLIVWLVWSRWVRRRGGGWVGGVTGWGV